MRLAVEALAAARADARARGDLPAGLAPAGTGHDDPERSGVSAPRPGGLARAPAAGAPAGRTRSRWPARSAACSTREGWQQRAAMGSVFGRWAEIVGADLAAHTRPDSFADGELAVTADSTAWATQVRLLAPVLVKRLNAELGDGSVRRVKVRGPAPPRQRGGWRVPGSKGPGDTYG